MVDSSIDPLDQSCNIQGLVVIVVCTQLKYYLQSLQLQISVMETGSFRDLAWLYAVFTGTMEQELPGQQWQYSKLSNRANSYSAISQQGGFIFGPKILKQCYSSKQCDYIKQKMCSNSAIPRNRAIILSKKICSNSAIPRNSASTNKQVSTMYIFV